MTRTQVLRQWTIFASKLRDPPPMPRIVMSTLPWRGHYAAGTVTLSYTVPVSVVHHEFAHWLFDYNRVWGTWIGADFLKAIGRRSWDWLARELFAACLAWLTCGRWFWKRSPAGAEALRPLLKEGT